ncbi:HEPN domain-containing protein [Indioceanicola profundi]|uniref:HEPN domain-containing protein n=1 Tax=Indioceanicola profundi TaxID=2220096 RepID=UPI0013C53920|nr:HEPN domain-containing protein [Indioceanicola profundi]
MTPETARSLELARHILARSERLAADGYAEIVGHDCYLAAFHAANAYIAATTGKIPVTHHGTNNLFHQLCREKGEIGLEHAAFLSRSYKYKAAADYLGEHYPAPGEVPGILAGAHALLEAVRTALRP